MRVTIIGAGVAGLTAATEFHTNGYEVSIIARSTHIGDDCCSWFAGGMIAPWCEGETAEEPVTRLGAQALDWWEKHCSYVERRGTLVLSHSRDMPELRRFARRTTFYDRMDQAAIATLEPDLSERFNDGLFFAKEGHINPRKALIELADQLQRQGVVILLGTDANQINIEADIIIDTRGFAARDQLSDLRGVRGEMLLIHSDDIEISRPVRLLHPRIPLYIVPRGNGIYMVGATMIESDHRKNLSVRSALEMLGAAYVLHPAFGEAEIIETASDVRPAFPNNLPRIRRQGKTLYINGLYRHGFLLAPALARMAVAIVNNANTKPEFLEEMK